MATYILKTALLVVGKCLAHGSGQYICIGRIKERGELFLQFLFYRDDKSNNNLQNTHSMPGMLCAKCLAYFTQKNIGRVGSIISTPFYKKV